MIDHFNGKWLVVCIDNKRGLALALGVKKFDNGSFLIRVHCYGNYY